MTTELYRNTVRDKITVVITSITGDNKNANVHVTAKTPMFMVLYDLHGRIGHIIELTADHVDQSGDYVYSKAMPITTELDWYARKTVSCSYVYSIKTRETAEIYQSLIPYQDYGTSIHVEKYKDLISIGRTNIIGVYNVGTEEYYVNGTLIPSKTVTFVTVPNGITACLTSQSIRVGTGPPKDVSFDGLTPEEKEQYVPNCITWNTKIRASDKYDWEPADKYIYRGTLQYHPTRDKEIHMRTEDNLVYRYNMDGFRSIVNHMNNGKVSGVFKYEPRRTGRSVQYHLVLMKSTLESDLLLCDSDDSDSGI